MVGLLCHLSVLLVCLPNRFASSRLSFTCMDVNYLKSFYLILYLLLDRLIVTANLIRM